MNALPVLRLGPIARLSLGLMALLVSLVLLADMALGVVPGRGETERQVRQRVAENLALQLTSLLEAGDSALLGKTVQQVLTRDAKILAITVRRSDGSMALQRGQAAQPVDAADRVRSTTDHLRVPILADGREPWGEIDIRFAQSAPTTLRAWLAEPSLQLLLVLGLGGFGLCYAYLKRAMHYLDPSASVPDRVRKAFDSLAEGLLIVDQQARVVLANRAFRALHPRAGGELNGRRIDTLDWLQGADLGGPEGAPAWRRTLASGEAVQAQPVALPQPEGPPLHLLVSSAPITDNKARARGCLITFDDVTAVHRANEELRQTLAELESSRRRIEEQNDELRRLAARDPLTGCYNRRAFFELAGEQFARARAARTPLCVLMVDIDHFKQFNDRYGHAVGDQVIQVVARALSAGLRQGDLLARYGGEEFCVLLPGTSAPAALQVAERMRADIEANARSAVRGTEVMPITASFGAAAPAFGEQRLEAVIDLADQALYRSKQAGRNRVTLWQAGAS